jgi:3-deoxy-D-manno-octulosonic-acid transferase
MFKFFYSLGISFYYFIVLVVSIFNKKAKLWINGRKKVFSKLKNFDFSKSKNIWFHVSSLGEFEQARPLIEKIKKLYPKYKIILTFFSPSGYEIRKTYNYADFVSYLPSDTIQNSKKFINKINPKLVFFVKYDFWFNYLNTLYNKKIPTFLISGIFRKNQIFFKKIGKPYQKVLNFFDILFVQNKESIDLLKSINISKTILTGDTRYDRVIEIAESSIRIEIAEKFVNEKTCLIAGSTWLTDEKLLCDFINNCNNNFKFIIAPHQIEENHILELLLLLKKPTVRFSKAVIDKVAEYQVLIIDNIGMLSSIYKYGQVAYIGGGFGNGIHNILEATVYGVPVIFGPNYKKFNEAIEMINIKTAFSISIYEEFNQILKLLLTDDFFRKNTSKKAKEFVYTNKGASDKIFKEIEKYF